MFMLMCVSLFLIGGSERPAGRSEPWRADLGTSGATRTGRRDRLSRRSDLSPVAVLVATPQCPKRLSDPPGRTGLHNGERSAQSLDLLQTPVGIF
jgi:hypothetical protein